MEKGFAPVSPIWLLEKLGKDAGNYHLPLAHDVMKLQAFYKDFFTSKDYTKDGLFTRRTVIMDNSVIELGASVEVDTLLDACEICNATHLVLPDALEDSHKTIEMSFNAWQKIQHRENRPKIAVVPQGATLADWIMCAEELDRAIDIDLWCVPRNFEGRLGKRYMACDLLKAIHHKPIHLIGFSHWIWADVVSTQHPSVIGIDSAVPVRLGQNCQLIQMSSDAGSRGDWWEKTSNSTPLFEATRQNLKTVRKWINP
jgi:hypothetical protein